MSKAKAGLALILAGSLAFMAISPALASPSLTKSQAAKAVISLKADLKKANSTLESLNSNQQTELDNALRSAAANQSSIQSKYETERAAATNALKSANSDLAKYSVFKVMVGNLSVCGDSYQTHCDINTIVTIPPTVPITQVNVPSQIKMGTLVPTDPTNYQKALDTISSLQDKILMLDSYISTDKNNNEAAYKTVSDKIYISYRPQIESTQDKVKLLKSTILAATRAQKAGSDFYNAFQTAVIFDFNYQSIKVVANSTFDSINTLYALYVVRDAIKYVGIGDDIDGNYSTSKAKSFNKYYGNTFYDDEFKGFIKNSTNLYLSAAK